MATSDEPSNPSDTTQISAAEQGIPVVGIGASAGGLEAIQGFFEAMPTDSGAAFVVIQHLSPDYKSLMVELLSRKTGMAVNRAEDGMRVQPNQVYLIPPKKNLTIFHGHLILKDQQAHDGLNLPVDIFFQSLAEDLGDQSIAIVLSGTGSDGTRGIRAIKESGGLVMVQDEESAQFNGMPRAAASTGLADYILRPEEMPLHLIAYLKHPYSPKQPRSERIMGDESGLTRIFSMLRARTKVDFTYYKPSTILRRIERRINVTQVDDLSAYAGYLEENAAEVTTLYRELLIGVTSFFRDPEVMRELQAVFLRQLIQANPGRELRFWVAGCSTGEEAYSLAILARETMEELGVNRDIKIFATDIDREAVLTAGNGVFPESVAADLKGEFLTKYFYRRGNQFHVARNLREMVVFAQHNLVKDPPFTNIDLVSCRNLLIYLQSNLQRKALEMFNFSLRPDGVLLLGMSESIGDMDDCFEPINRKLKIFRSKGRSPVMRSLDTMSEADARRFRITSSAVRSGVPARQRSRVHEQLLERLLDTISECYTPLTVVVNEHLEVLHVLGDTTGYFKFPSGRTVLDISKLVDRELSIPLATGIQKVFRSQTEMVYTNVRQRGYGPDSNRNLRLRMRPLKGLHNQDPMVVVFIEEMRTAAEPAADAPEQVFDLDVDVQQRLQDLDQELQFTRENLQATIEELETSNEELQATNEELLASNEELQSTNEELQSTNEELYTVNAEYQDKITELTESNNDVENLLTSSRIGTMLLDEDLLIRRYSPEAANIFNLLDKDIDRPISHLSHRLVDFDPVQEAREVQKSGKSTEKHVLSEDGKWYLIRTTPYAIGPQDFSGIVLSFVDVSDLRSTQTRLERSHVLRFIPGGVFMYRLNNSGELIFDGANSAALAMIGKDADALAGKRFDEIWPNAAKYGLTKRFREVVQSGLCFHDTAMSYLDDRIDATFEVHAFPLYGKRLAVSFNSINHPQ